MTLHEHDVQHEDLAKVNAQSLPYQTSRSPLALLANFIGKTFTIAEWEARKIRHDATDLVTRAIQPALWILVFGEVFTRIRAIPTGSKNVSYLEFMAPGILAQSVLFISIFAGIAIIWERDLGVIHKFLASPTPRGSLVLGKALSSGIRALPQAIVIYLLALILGVKMNFNPLALLGVLVFVVMGAGCFSTFSLIIACLLKTRDRVMGIGQVLTMPMFFASNAIYPIAIMPSWLQAIAHINPLTYVVDGLRSLMLANTAINMADVSKDFGILLIVTIVLVTIGAMLYPRIVQ
ncbi:ABC transporter permease [Dictyobacter kobayashii]|uniref:Transport permease protein n=1 Tax=Dictyobacter kobayashii TaxID=2014872 RepID=A0A402AU23_9CHLR|nr:ABC transporter permease [Dictyobacter kobayashii]GCE22608.1 transport permease protein [Dictyobacter kobayashii]